MSQEATIPSARPKRTAALTLGALGVVFGDIGTSPLYTVKECFSEFTGILPTHDNVLGILSLITWALIIVVTLKYVVVVMRADNRGEGGVLALMALVSRQEAISERRRRLYLMIGLAGAALFYGDCLLTPAISVLSAVEGLKVATPALQPLVVPIALGVLVALFTVQKFGTGGVGRWFGPITLLWFIVLLGLGLRQIVEAPQVLSAFSPHHAVQFCLRHGFVAFLALGAVTLAVTGAEALYADMGHFGREPIRRAWLYLVLPSLLANYYGQGALLLTDSSALENPFFRLAPDWALYPMVALATMATVIAFRPDLSAGGQLAAPRRRGGAGAVLQVVDQSRGGLWHRRYGHHAGHHGAGVRAGGARLEMELGAGSPGVRRLPAGRRHAVLRQHVEVPRRWLGAAGHRRADIRGDVDLAAGPPRRCGAREGGVAADRDPARQHRPRPRPPPARHGRLPDGVLRQCTQLPAAQPQAQRGLPRARGAADRRGAG